MKKVSKKTAKKAARAAKKSPTPRRKRVTKLVIDRSRWGQD